MHGRLTAAALATLAVVSLTAGRVDDDRVDGGAGAVRAPQSPPTTVVDWRESQQQAVVAARQALWLGGQPTAEPPTRLEVESVVVEEVDGALVAVLDSCMVSTQGLQVDILGGQVRDGAGYVTDARTEVLGHVGGTWQWILWFGGRHWDGEAGCAVD